MERIEKTVDGTTWFRISEDDNSIRYILGTKGQRTLCCLGINPSTADIAKPDSTVRFVTRIAQHNGYDSFIMLNVCPTRCTIFENLSHQQDPIYAERNLAAIAMVLSDLPQPIDLWVAYGNNIDKREYTKSCLEQLKTVFNQFGCRYYHASLTKAGHPHHPLYLKNTTKLQPFDWA